MKRLIVLFVCLTCLGARAQKTAEAEKYTPSPQERTMWDSLIRKGVEEVIFTKRYTYDSNHYYTEFINSTWKPGGNICILSLKTGKVRELVPGLNGGVFGRFDVSFDARRIVFAYKPARDKGYRIYEVNTDGTGLRQLTFDAPDEAQITKRFGIASKPHFYPHGTEDLDPCYLPDGGIVFISTRCRYGILCDMPDIFSTTVLYRMDRDGKNMRKLTNSAVSENTPTVMNDGRILYTRWEYVDKGSVIIKCLWAMMPDGSGSVEIYGNNIDFPPTLIFGRQIPGSANEFVVTGTPHYPQNCVGTVIRVDISKDIRTRAPMTYITPYVDIRAQGGFVFRDESEKWTKDRKGVGPLFREAYPLSRSEFLVSHKPRGGEKYSDPTGYGLYMLDEKGRVAPVYRDAAISCFNPTPLVARKTPPVIPSRVDPGLAKQNLAECIVTDVYRGMAGVERGEAKYIRVWEQVPRPWGARMTYDMDVDEAQPNAVAKETHLGLKVQYGVVPIEADGSARFLVPADKNIFLQVLDKNYMSLQTERTYVNYIPGEVRSCVGCHETPGQTPLSDGRVTPIAMSRKAELPGPQPGEKEGRRTIDYVKDVQPVWDKYCIECHTTADPAGGLDLTGGLTKYFNVSYEALMPAPQEEKDPGLVGLMISEVFPEESYPGYLPPKSVGSYSAVLAGMLAGEALKLPDARAQARADALIASHKGIRLTPEELLRVTNWIDSNGQYYSSYFGKRHISFRGDADFRLSCTFDQAIAPEPPATK